MTNITTVHPDLFDIVIQKNSQTAEVELFILIDSSLSLINENKALFNKQGVATCSYLFPATDLYDKVVDLNIPIHSYACLQAINPEGATIDKQEVPLTVHPVA